MADSQLKLIALDEQDLEIVSSHLQDAVVRVGDLAYVPSQKRFAAILNRFNWEKAAKAAAKRHQRTQAHGAALRSRARRPDQVAEAFCL